MNNRLLFFLFVLSSLTVILPRRLAAIPVLASVAYMAVGQSIDVLGQNFTAIRIVIFVAWLRLITRRELFRLRLNGIDRYVIAYVLVGCVAYVLLWRTTGSVFNRMGYAYNVLGSYLLFRFLIRDFDEVVRILFALCLLLVPLALAMGSEKATGNNVFSVFGGVPMASAIRDGQIRCQGPFRHPILAGTFGITTLPLFLGLFVGNVGRRPTAVIGCVSALVVALTPASSGPLMAAVFVVLGCLAWPLRRRMSAVRWTVVLTIAGIALAMKAPIWFLIGRVGNLVGGTGYHRSALLDSAIKHFGEWWIIGTNHTSHWMPYVLPNNPNMVDITNQFLLVGIEGGILALVCFIIVIIRCFGAVGRIVAIAGECQREVALVAWFLGVSLLAHFVSFFSVSYFDQMIVVWSMILAMISVLSDTEYEIVAWPPKRWEFSSGHDA